MSKGFQSSKPSAELTAWVPPTWANCTNPHAVFPRWEQPRAFPDPIDAISKALKADDMSWSEALKQCFPIHRLFQEETSQGTIDEQLSQDEGEKVQTDLIQDYQAKALEKPEEPIGAAEKTDVVDFLKALEGILEEPLSRTAEPDQTLTKSRQVLTIKYMLEHPPITRAMKQDDIQRVKEIIAGRDPERKYQPPESQYYPLEYALKTGDFTLADFLKKHGEKTSRPCVFLVADPMGAAILEGELDRRLDGYDALKIRISVPSGLSGNEHEKGELINQLRAFLRKLPLDANRPQAVLSSGLKEVEAIKKYAAQIFEHCDGIWLHGNIQDIWSDWYEMGGYDERYAEAEIYQDILTMALLELQQQATYKPLLGVDRGMLLTNVFHGGTLVQHRDRMVAAPTLPTVNHGMLGSALPFEMLTWSSQIMTIDRIGSGLQVAAISNITGSIKAIQSDTDEIPLMGTQFHPESTIDQYKDVLPSDRYFIFENTHKQILDRFFDAVKASYEETCLAHDLQAMKLR
ncbi:MAG: gamma-glutamyl-gamma-aminobutyrate hydrolase family protein [Candidatus Berkiellales bacterium]